MYPKEHTVIVNVVLLEELGVIFKLLDNQGALFRAKRDQSIVFEPIEVLQGLFGIDFHVILLARDSTVSGTLQVVAYVDLSCSVKHVGHNDEVDPLSLSGFDELDFVEAVESGDHGMRESDEMVVVLFHYEFEMLELIVRDGFKHELAICSVIKK
jgi:hypothetical protein